MSLRLPRLPGQLLQRGAGGGETDELPLAAGVPADHQGFDAGGVAERQGKLGLGTAYIMGFKWSLKQGYDFIFEMDADFSHDPNMKKPFMSRIPWNTILNLRIRKYF